MHLLPLGAKDSAAAGLSIFNLAHHLVPDNGPMGLQRLFPKPKWERPHFIRADRHPLLITALATLVPEIDDPFCSDEHLPDRHH
jgi:hypothetical protein